MPVFETRRFRRFAVNVPCLVKPARAVAESKESTLSAKTKDISRGGLCFVADSRWEIGSEIECVIELQVGPLSQAPVKLRCWGKVVHVTVNEKNRVEVGATIEHHSFLTTIKKDKSTTGCEAGCTAA